MAMFFDPYGSSGTSAFGGGSGDSITPSLYAGLLDENALSALRQRGMQGFLGGMQKSGSLDYVDPFTGVKIGGLAAGLAGGAAAMGEAQDTASLNALRAQLIALQGKELQGKLGLYNAANQPAPLPPFGQPFMIGAPDTSGPAKTGPGGVEPAAGIGAAPAVSSQTADATLPPEARALLDSISGPESSGAYNIRYTPSGGTTFDSFDQHPNIAERTPDGKDVSTAAGRYQMVVSTYRPLAEKYGLQDFSPVSQDQAAWHLAQDTYNKSTGRDLLGDLQGGDTSRVASALRGQWPTIGRAIGSYTDNLGKYTAAGTALGGNAGGGDLAAVPDFSGMMQGHAGAPYAPSAPVMSGSSQPPGGAARAPTLAEGDSIGVGFQKFGGLQGNAVGGRNPQAVLGNIATNLKNDPNYYKGQTVLLSSGTMNDPNGENTDLIPEQIKTIKAAGGNVILAGADTGKFASRNAQLAQIAQATGVPFAGALPTDNVHPGPDGYKAYVGTNAPLALRIAQNGAPAAPVRLAQNGPPTSLAPAMPQAQAPQAPMAQGQTGMVPGGAGQQINPAWVPYIQWAQQQARIRSALGIPVPADIAEAAKLPLVGPTTAAQKWAGVAPDLYTAWHKPMDMRVNGMVIDPSTGRIVARNPAVPEGYTVGQGPNGQPIAEEVPGAIAGIVRSSTARAAGPATFKAEEIPGPYGRENFTTALNLPNILGAGGGATTPTAVSGGMATGLSVAPPTPPQGSAETTKPWQAAVPVPVKTPQGVKDLSAVTVDDMFPGGQGIPRPPTPPPGMTYGKPSETELTSQKHDAALLEQYQKETSGNQKIYQDLSHLSEVLQRGLNTNKLAPLWTDLTNVAQGMGRTELIPKDYDPNDAAVFQKAATDLVFAAVKKLAGQVRVAEIEGYKQANPGMTLPLAANVSIVNDVLSNGKWEDARAKLASEYVTQTGGAPLSAFNARFNNMAPLVDVTNAYKGEFQKAGFKFPGDQTKDTMPAGATDKRVIGGTTYYKVGNQWFK